MSLFIRGEGGFGGDSGPKVGNAAPERAPDGVVERKTLPQQALIYRLSGDKNPLHADPEFAKLGGFDTPIIHGLCSYGIACKAIVDQVLGGDVTQVARYQARFAGVSRNSRATSAGERPSASTAEFIRRIAAASIVPASSRSAASTSGRSRARRWLARMIAS